MQQKEQKFDLLWYTKFSIAKRNFKDCTAFSVQSNGNAPDSHKLFFIAMVAFDQGLSTFVLGAKPITE